MSLRSQLRLLRTLGQGVARGLPDATPDRDPLDLLEEWWAAAEEAGLFLPESCALATATPDGSPSCRMVLLKGLDARGLVFYTNYRSRKAREMDANPRASLCFHWGVLERQVRVEGSVERISEEESLAYFRSRPRGSRIGAWASRQSQVLSEREVLEERVAELKERFEGEEIPLPSFWGGYRLRPRRMEFWQGRADRLHDRLVFERDEGDPGPQGGQGDDGDEDAAGAGWTTRRLYP